MMDLENTRRLPTRENDNCFACSPSNPSGLHMEFYTDGERVFSRLKVPEHLTGWGDIVHGGITTTILDEAMGWCALHLLKKFTLTKSISVEFKKPIHVGRELRIESRMVRMDNEREVVTEGEVLNEAGELCAKGTGVYALFTPQAIRKLGIMDERILQGVEKVLDL